MTELKLKNAAAALQDSDSLWLPTAIASAANTIHMQRVIGSIGCS